MSYVLEKFAASDGGEQNLLYLPGYEVSHVVGPGPALTRYSPTVGGGMYDGLGSGRALSLAQIIRYSGAFAADDQGALVTSWDAIGDLYGRKGRLWRKWTRIGNDAPRRQWCWARMTHLELQSGREQTNVQPVTMEFTRQSAWFDETETEQTTAVPLASYTYTVAHAGTAPVMDAVLTFTAQGSAVTSLAILTDAGGAIEYSGTIAPATTLVIDCGAHAVYNDGANAIAGFSLRPEHVGEEWFVIAPGAAGTSISVVRTGGGSGCTLKITHSGAWI